MLLIQLALLSVCMPVPVCACVYVLGFRGQQVVTRQRLGGGGREVGEWRRRCLAFQQVGGRVQR